MKPSEARFSNLRSILRLIWNIYVEFLINDMRLKIGDDIFYEKDGIFYVDRVSDVLSTSEGVLYQPVENDFWCVTEDEILDDSDKRVQDYKCMIEDTTVKLSDVRNWLRYNACRYYEPGSWSSFKDEDMIKDLCKSMLYG